jgi:hypothetical protein
VIGDRWLREKGGKDDSFASAIQANATSIGREKRGYQNDATRMDPRIWLKPGAAHRKRSANVSARRDFRPTNLGDRTPLFHLHYRLQITDHSPGNAENADIAASAGSGNAERFPISTNQRDAI